MKIFNPLIWMWNHFKYAAHLETFRDCLKDYELYDFKKKETKYF